MGFFDRIRNAFKKEETKEEVELSLEELISQLDKKIAEQESEIIEKSYGNIETIENELESLSQLIGSLEKLQPEGIMPGPKAVKERFCSYSKNQVASIKMPSKDLDEIREFLNKTYSIVHNLGGLTQRQIMHIEFFFKEDFRPIIKKSREISDMINETRGIMRSKNSGYEQVKNLHEKIKELDKTRSEKNSKMAVISDGVERLKTENEKLSVDVSKIDIGDFKKYREEINALENEKNLIEQNIASFLSIEKLLKKLIHENETEDELLDMYTESPVKALLRDGEMKIMGFVKAALELHGKGSIDVDEKKIEKANNIINNIDHLKKQKKELLVAIEELEKKKGHMQNVIAPKIEEKKKLEGEKSRTESDMKKLQESLEKIPKELAGIEDQKKALKKKIADTASEIMGMNVRIR